MITRPETQTSAGSAARIAVERALGAPDLEIAWCAGHYELVDGVCAWIGRAGCNCGPERVRHHVEVNVRADAFQDRISALSGNEAKWALRRLVEDLEHGLDVKILDHALAIVEPGGTWHEAAAAQAAQ